MQEFFCFLGKPWNQRPCFLWSQQLWPWARMCKCADENRGRLQLEWKWTSFLRNIKVSFPALNQGNDRRRWTCRRGRRCRRHCQLDCSKDDSSLPVVMVILTFWSLSYSPLAPRGRKLRIIFDWLYVSHFSAYSNNWLIEPRGWRRRNPYL